MVRFLFKLVLLIFPITNYALDGVITVLEAPLFSQPDEKSSVIQYIKKGHDIYIHSEESTINKFKNRITDKDTSKYAQKSDDKITGDSAIYIPDENSIFYKTLTASGREAYILKEHVFIHFKDSRELDQKVIKKDNTDYRLAEPLNENYPFNPDEGLYRGQFVFATGQPNFQAYNFKQEIKDTSFSLIKEFNFVYSKAQKLSIQRRYFFGLTGGIHFSSYIFKLETQKVTQANTRFYVGPYFSYDIYRQEKYVLNIYTSLQIFLYDNMEINAKDSNAGVREIRNYQSLLSVSPSIGSDLQIKDSFFTFDTVFGFNARAFIPKTYKAQNSGQTSAIWNELSEEDTIEQSIRLEASAFIGIQSHY